MKSFFQKYLPELVVFLILTSFVVLELINNRFWLNDFRVYYGAANQFVQGANVYGETYGLLSGVYKYSPLSLFLFLPFTLFSFKTACFLFSFLNILVITSLFRIIKNSLTTYSFTLSSRLSLWVSLLGLIILGNHFFRELHLGNINVLLLLLALCSFILLQKEKKIISGILLAICILFKPYFFILTPVFVLRKESKWTFSFAAALLAGLFLPALFIGFRKNNQLLADWILSMTMHNATDVDYANTTYYWIWQILQNFGIDVSSQILFGLITGIVALLFLFIWRKHSKDEKLNKNLRNPNFLMEYFLLIACIPNVAKTDTEHFLLSMPIILFLLEFLFSQKLPGWGKALVIIGFIAYGGNWYDLVGSQISSFWSHWGILGIGNWILIMSTLFFHEKYWVNSKR